MLECAFPHFAGYVVRINFLLVYMNEEKYKAYQTVLLIFISYQFPCLFARVMLFFMKA